MTIVSRGYEGQIMPNLPWAEWQQCAGHEYVASHYDAGRVTVVTSTPLTVRVNAGPVVRGLRAGIGGHGVYDIITVAEDITISNALPGAGQSKWYTIAARRTWQTTQATTLVALTGTAAEAIAAGRQQTPGTVDEQPLALVQVTNGTSGLAITAVRDLRPVSQGGEYVIDPASRDVVMSYFNKPGYRLRVGDTAYVRTIIGGIEAWQPDGAAVLSGSIVGYPAGPVLPFTVGPFPFAVNIVAQNGDPLTRPGLVIQAVDGGSNIPAGTVRVVNAHMSAFGGGGAVRINWVAARSA